MAKRYTGIRARGNSVQVDLPINGQRARFSIPIPPTKASFEYASRTRESALLAIQMKTFKAADFFPNSKSSFVKQSQTPTIKEALESFLKDSERTLSPSTYRDYKSAIDYHLVPTFGDNELEEITPLDIRTWINSLDISSKRINNILIPLRKVFTDAYCSELIDSNPLVRIKHLPHKTKAPDPFTLDEIDQILNHCPPLTRELFQFAFWTGLRTSELIALEWQDIDLPNKQAYICKAEVRGTLKQPKTYSGKRTIALLPPALTALKSVLRLTPNPVVRVFVNPNTRSPWISDGQIRKTAWAPALDAAGIEYRRPYQTRHTYASQLLSLGFPPMWVAQQMGHRDWGMIRRVYGRWIKETRPEITQLLEDKLAQIGHMVT
jgi:integrase